MKKKQMFMNIKDKEEISDIRCCPPHYLPHKFPIGEKICDEKCHIHKAKWRMVHHIFFCRRLKCLNYKFMTSKNKEYNEF
ncbi:hypothetical protein HOC35_04630 [Candidatus Woesearchaeota archaeon]|jgi:hypothetical protein|nr:hypothetical protein [Candidatus Woesearchaeota archaeon]